MNEKLIAQALKFLSNPSVKSSDKPKQVNFLKSKGLTDQDIEEVYKRLESAPSDSTTKPLLPVIQRSSLLNLNRKSITELPPLSPYLNIKVLVISNNQLTCLPSSIHLLMELEIVNAGYNKLTNEGIPEEFFDLFLIRHLNLEHNEIRDLKPFTRLHSLEKLNISYNKITEIPDEILQLQSLSCFWAQRNPLKAVSRNLSLLPSLKHSVIVTSES